MKWYWPVPYHVNEPTRRKSPMNMTVATGSSHEAMPATRRGELRRDALLEAATAAFLEHGYAGVSLDSIVATAGGSKRTLYDLFGDKAGLFGAVMARECRTLVEQMEATDLGPLSLRDGLVSIGTTFVGFLLSPKALALYRVLVTETPQFPELGARFFEAGPDATRSRLVRFLKARTQSGELHLVDADLAARQLLGMFKGDLHLRGLLYPQTLPRPAKIRAQVEHATDLFLAGAGKP